MTVYLASPFFNKYEKTNMERVLKVLRASGYEVYAPYELKIDNAWNIPNHEWGLNIFIEDIHAIEECDCMVAINYGLYSDSGTAFEIGYAIGRDKPVFSVNFEGFVDSVMLNNAVAGMISFEYFKENNKIDLYDFFGAMIYNEQK